MKKYCLKYKGRNGMIAIAIVVMTFIQVGTSLIHTFAFNALLESNIKGFIQWYMIGFVLWFVYIVGNTLLEINKTKTIQLMIKDMRSDYVDTIIQKSFREFKEEDVGGYLSTLNNDMNLIETSGFQNLYNIIAMISLTGLSLVTLLSFDFRILLLTITMTLALTFVPRLWTQRIMMATQLLSDGSSKFLTNIHDMISGYEDLYYLGNKETLRFKIDDASNRLVETKIMVTKQNGRVNSMISFLSISAQIGIMMFTGLLAYFGAVSFGAITSTASVAGNVFGSLSSCNQYLMGIKSIKPIVSKLEGMDEDREKVYDVILNSDQKGFDGIEITNMGFKYNDEFVFTDFNLNINRNNKYAVVGASGSGKSTLINLLLGNLKEYTGSILFNGIELNRIDENDIMKQVSFIGNSVHIFEDTLMNNITLWEPYPDELIREALLKAHLDTFSEELDQRISSKELSEGEKQRIGLARAFLKNRSILIFDEATANLDAVNTQEIENLILENKELTFITVTHHLKKERESLFDTVIRL